MGFSTFATEYGRLQALAGDTSTANVARFKEMVNDAILEIVAAHDWAWLRNAFTDAFNLEAPYSTGTVSTTAGSTTLTGSGAAWTTAGLSTSAGIYEILIGGEVYGVQLTGNNTGTLTRAAISTLSGVTFTVWRRIYSLSARMRSIEAAWCVSGNRWPVAFLSGMDFALRNSGTPAVGAVEAMAFANIDSSDVSQVLVDPPPSAVGSVYYTGFQEVAVLTSDNSVIPLPPRFLPCFHKLAEKYLWHYRHDGRETKAEEEGAGLLAALIQRDDPSQGELDRGNLDPQVFRSGSLGAIAPSRSGRLY